jgi:PIN domain nuclease of toxin-antitoxin system
LNLLLDTHILLWWFASDRHLSSAARIAITESDRRYVSAATAWEINIKVALGKLEFHGNMEEQIALNDFVPLSVTVSHAVAAGKLPLHHRDPFDRMLVAQAIAESLTLVTHDARLSQYGVATMLV